MMCEDGFKIRFARSGDYEGVARLVAQIHRLHVVARPDIYVPFDSIIVNGQVAGRSGNPAEKRNYEAVNRPYAGYFTLKPGWNEIIVQAANYEFPASSGINESIDLGYAAQISELRDKALTHDWITFTVFLMMGLYFVGLYSQRKNDYSLIVFGLVCVFFALFTSTRGERVLFSLFGSVPFWLYLRIQMVSALGAGMGFPCTCIRRSVRFAPDG